MASASINAAVTALRGITSANNVVAQNVANGSTPGYKAKEARFEAMVGSSGLNSTGKYSPGGSRVHVAQNVELQGSFLGSEEVSNVAIVGKGLLVGSPNPKTDELVYTAAGDATVMPDGTLVTSGGIVLKGWQTDSNGVELNGASRGSLQNINTKDIDQYYVQTTNLAMRANITSDTLLTDVPIQVNFPVIDSLGDEHTFTASFARTSIDPNLWNVSITCPDAANVYKGGTTDDFGGVTPMVLRFDDYGLVESFDGNPTPPGIDVVWNNASTNAADMSVVMNLGTVGTNDGLVSLAKTSATPRIEQDGVKMAKASGFEINESGLLSIVFENGERLPRWQFAVALFPAVNKLDPVAGNAFAQTATSGDPSFGKPNEGGYGKLVSGQIESSNVDFAAELTKMIELQHAFSGNTKVITTSDHMLQELLNVK